MPNDPNTGVPLMQPQAPATVPVAAPTGAPPAPAPQPTAPVAQLQQPAELTGGPEGQIVVIAGQQYQVPPEVALALDAERASAQPQPVQAPAMQAPNPAAPAYAAPAPPAEPSLGDTLGLVPEAPQPVQAAPQEPIQQEPGIAQARPENEQLVEDWYTNPEAAADTIEERVTRKLTAAYDKRQAAERFFDEFYAENPHINRATDSAVVNAQLSQHVQEIMALPGPHAKARLAQLTEQHLLGIAQRFGAPVQQQPAAPQGQVPAAVAPAAPVPVAPQPQIPRTTLSSGAGPITPEPQGQQPVMTGHPAETAPIGGEVVSMGDVVRHRREARAAYARGAR